MSAFCVLSYNILADAYARAEWYPNTPSGFLKPTERIERIIERLLGLSPDIVCLQEVEPKAYEIILASLETHEYAGSYVKKENDRPDGCAFFHRTTMLEEVQSINLTYDDSLPGREASGHVAQLKQFKQGGRQLVVANTHIRWDPPGTAAARGYGCFEASELMETCRKLASVDDGLVVCGDFNAGPDSDVVTIVTDAGLFSSHRDEANQNTSNANGEAKTLDYIMHNVTLLSTAVHLPEIDERTPLPGPDEPSDHLPVFARFDWRTEQV